MTTELKKNGTGLPLALCGKRVIAEAIRSGRMLEKVFIVYGTEHSIIEELKHEAKKTGIPITITDKNQFYHLEKDCD